MSDRKLVLVEWWDTAKAAEIEPGEHLLPVQVVSVGYLYEHNQEWLTLVSDIVGEDEDELRDVTTILRSTVIREIELAPRYRAVPDATGHP